jgi:hypothetical protein
MSKKQKPIYEEPDIEEEIENDDYAEEITKKRNSKIQAPKVKREVSLRQQEILKKGREALKAKKEAQLKEKQEYLTKLAVKKTNNIIKSKMKIKKEMGLNPEETDEEEPIVQIQQKKPKKKQVIYLPPESDSEEEIIYKKAPKTSKPKAKPEPEPEPVPQPIPIHAPIPRHKIVFC